MRHYLTHAAITAILVMALAGCKNENSKGGSAKAASTPAPAGTAASSTPPAAPAQEQPEVLTSGPVHESFAEPIDTQAQSGLTVSTQPPENIDETPPDEGPDGAVWVPGYWAWNSDQSRYIWVSGCWRVPPPNMYWVPGYWAQVAGGWEWVAGFWSPANVQDMEYLPEPPEVTDLIAPGSPPTPDCVWVPSCPYWVDGQYVSRPGYWLPCQVGWEWVPSHYVWTPRGYLFDAGHWDYSVDRRGVLFAPVDFGASMHVGAGFAFTPSICVDMSELSLNLFAYPRYCHFYFGDYYGSAYVSLGIYPWFDCLSLHTWYDPDFQYERWHVGHNDPKWLAQERHDYDTRLADKSLRPPRTYREMEARLAKAPEAERRNLEIARPFKEVAEAKGASMKFESISSATRQRMARESTEVSNFRQERMKWESSSAAGARPAPQPAEHRPEANTPVERPPQGNQPVEHPSQGNTPVEHSPQGNQPEPRPEPVRPSPAPAPSRQPESWKMPSQPFGNESHVGGGDHGAPARPPEEDRGGSGGQEHKK